MESCFKMPQSYRMKQQMFLSVGAFLLTLGCQTNPDKVLYKADVIVYRK
jgi:hypothetical protein